MNVRSATGAVTSVGYGIGDLATNAGTNSGLVPEILFLPTKQEGLPAGSGFTPTPAVIDSLSSLFVPGSVERANALRRAEQESIRQKRIDKRQKRVDEGQKR